MKENNPIKDDIQRQAHSAWLAVGRQGTIAAGTGFGKSRIPIIEIRRMLEEGKLEPGDILLVTPTEKLRDVNWPNEFHDWGEEELLQYVEGICFASLKKEVEKRKHRKLVILDEIHRLTELSAQAFAVGDGDSLTAYFAEALADAVIGLTATVPDHKRDPEKARIIAQVAPIVYHYTLDQGVEDGMIADYEIRVIQVPLNNTDKVISAGTKAKPFKTTELSQYEYLEKNIRKNRMLAQTATDPRKAAQFERMTMFATMARNRFIGNLPSKTALAKQVISIITKDSKRTLVFCSSIEQCNELMGDSVYHSKSGSAAFNRFNARELSALGVVNAANEGINFTDLDQGLIVQVDSNERNLTQRVGRMLRVRDGHKAIVYILVAQNTADERWLEKSLQNFDSSKIRYYSSKSVPT